MTVYRLMIKQRKLCKHSRVSVYDGIVVHDLSKAEDTLVAYERIHIVSRKHASVVIDISCRNARRHHDEHIGVRLLGLVENVLNAVSSGYIACLMRVYNEGCSSERCCRCNKFCRGNHR